MTLAEFLDNPDLVKEYIAWVNADIAHIVFGVMQEEFCRPILPGKVGEKTTPSSSEFCLGECAGSWKMLDALKMLGKFKGENSEVPGEDYGANAIAKLTAGGTDDA